MPLEDGTVPSKEILRRVGQFIVALPRRHIGDAPMRRPPLAVDAE
jgi:hypothetical protein